VGQYPRRSSGLPHFGVAQSLEHSLSFVDCNATGYDEESAFGYAETHRSKVLMRNLRGGEQSTPFLSLESRHNRRT